jgi:hypothetical protein
MSVKVNITLIKDVMNAVSAKANKQAVGDLIITEMKNSISSGVSPVRGERRFVAYKDPTKYPADLKSKRPVNLFLSGDMLSQLKFYPLAANRFSIAIKGEEGKKARAHNEGIGVPRRHFMPTDTNEEFTVTITRKIRDLYARILSDIINRSKGR